MHASSDIYTMLKNDHTSVASLLQRLEQTGAHDTAKLQTLFGELKDILTQHCEAEESVAGSQIYDAIRHLADEVKQQGASIIQQQQGVVAEQIASIAGALHKTAEQLGHDKDRTLGQYTEQAATGLEQFSHKIRDQNFNRVLRQVQDFARQRPAVFIGSAALLGFAAARFLKSSAVCSPAPQRQDQIEVE